MEWRSSCREERKVEVEMWVGAEQRERRNGKIGGGVEARAGVVDGAFKWRNKTLD